MTRSISRRACAVSLSAVLATGVAVAVPELAGAASTPAGVSAAPLKTAGYASYPTVRYGSRGLYVRNLQWKLRMQVTGWFGPVTLRNVKRFQKAKGLPVTGVVTSATWRLLRPPPKRVAPRASRSAARAGIRLAVARLNWRALARCESGGRPTAVNPAGYYGLYQFNLGTWRSVGGSGYPHRASSAEQLYRAQVLYQRRGSRPWPVCGRLLYT
jgi:peptidoglycan hydrolase-like protein with peptidoglycan-binding domain